MRSILIAGCVLAALARPAFADDPPKKELTKAEKIYQALGERKNLDIKPQPLPKVIDAITVLTGVRFEVDSYVNFIGMGPFGLIYEIALEGEKTQVGTAFNRALAQHGLTWIVLGDRAMITTTERGVAFQMQQKISIKTSETLRKTLDDLARSYGVNVVIDPQAAKLADTKIEVDLKAIALEAGIHLLANLADLQVSRLDNLLYVTTPEKAKRIPAQPLTTPPPSIMGGAFGFGGQLGALGGQVGMMGGALGAGGQLGMIGGGLGGNFGVMGGALGQLGMIGGGLGGNFGVGGGPAPLPKKDTPPPKKKPSGSSSLSPRFAIPRLVMAAPVPDKPMKAPEEGGGHKLRKELNATVALDLVNMQLSQAINQLKEKTGIDFILDRTVLETHFMERTGNGMDGALVNAKLSKVPLRRGLRQMLAEFDLGFVIVGDQVLITTQAMTAHRMMRQPVSLDVDKTSFADALKKLARETGTNLVLDARAAKEGQEKVSLQLDDVPLETAVRLLAEQAGLRALLVDNVLYVTTKAKAAELREDPDFRPRQEPPVPGIGDMPPGKGMGGGLIPPMVLPVPPKGAGGADPNGGAVPEKRIN